MRGLACLVIILRCYVKLLTIWKSMLWYLAINESSDSSWRCINYDLCCCTCSCWGVTSCLMKAIGTFMRKLFAVRAAREKRILASRTPYRQILYQIGDWTCRSRMAAAGGFHGAALRGLGPVHAKFQVLLRRCWEIIKSMDRYARVGREQQERPSGDFKDFGL